MSRLGASCCCTARCSRSTRCWPTSTGVERADVLEVAAELVQCAADAERGRPLRRSATSSPTCPPWPPGSLQQPCSKVGVVGAGGRMGQEVCRAVTEAADLELVAAIDPGHVGGDACGRTIIGEVNALADLGAEVVVDFTIAEAVRHNVAHYAAEGIHAVIGTSGLSEADVADLEARFAEPAPPTSSWCRTSPSVRCCCCTSAGSPRRTWTASRSLSCTTTPSAMRRRGPPCTPPP